MLPKLLSEEVRIKHHHALEIVYWSFYNAYSANVYSDCYYSVCIGVIFLLFSTKTITILLQPKGESVSQTPILCLCCKRVYELLKKACGPNSSLLDAWRTISVNIFVSWFSVIKSHLMCSI